VHWDVPLALGDVFDAADDNDDDDDDDELNEDEGGMNIILESPERIVYVSI
jgi:hypothetical protein